MQDIPCEMTSSVSLFTPCEGGGCWQELLDSWFRKRPVEECNYLVGVVRSHVEKCIEYLTRLATTTTTVTAEKVATKKMALAEEDEDFELDNYNSTHTLLKIFDVRRYYTCYIFHAHTRIIPEVSSCLS